MFGIRKLKEQVRILDTNFDAMLIELGPLQRALNKIFSLEQTIINLQREIANPPKFKTGDVVGRYRVIEHSHFDSRGERHYRCLSSRSESLEDVRESNLSLAKAQEK